MLRLKRPNGDDAYLIVAVPRDSGRIHTQCGDSKLVLDPQDLSRIRTVFLEALAVALQDRGEW